MMLVVILYCRPIVWLRVYSLVFYQVCDMCDWCQAVGGSGWDWVGLDVAEGLLVGLLSGVI